MFGIAYRVFLLHGIECDIEYTVLNDTYNSKLHQYHMKMLVFERPFQRDLVEPCKPTNNFSRGPKGFSLKKWQPQKILKICFIAYCAILHNFG